MKINEIKVLISELIRSMNLFKMGLKQSHKEKEDAEVKQRNLE